MRIDMDYDKECHVLRFSYGKDSFKTLDVMHTRGMRLDMITTTDVWATENVPAWLPPMDEFKARMDQWIWTKYRLEVKHLCARNKDGSKRTYEQMFYHVPNRRSQSVQVERERERERRAPARLHPGIPGARNPMVSINPQKIGQATECRAASRDSRELQESTGARNSKKTGYWIQGFPAQISPWCRKLKIDHVKDPLFS